MERTVLVTLDGSPFAETALPLGVRLAGLAGAQLHLLLVDEPADLVVLPGAVPPPPEGWQDTQRKRARQYLSRTAKRLQQAGASKPVTRLVRGRPGPKICSEAKRLAADFVVLATHGRGSLSRLWFGSVADYVVRHIERPLLLVPPGRSDGESAIRRMLVALDLSPGSEAVLEPAAALAKLAGAELTLCHIAVEAFELDAQGVREAARHPVGQDALGLERRQAAVAELAERLRRGGARVDTLVRPGINAAGSLLDTLESGDYDLIALTTHGMSGVRRLLIGSVADKILRTATRPVLLARPPARK